MTEKKAKRPDLIIWGGTALTMVDEKSIIANAVIEVTGGKISRISSQKNPSAPRGVSHLDARGKLVLPGFINCHTHAGMSLLRGICDDKPLDEWLTKYIFPLERKWSSPKFVEVGTRLAAWEMLRSGTTTFSDMYYFSTTTAKVVHEMGLRAVVGQAIVDISGVERVEKIFGEVEKFQKAVAKFPKVTPALAPHSIYGLPGEKWKELVRYAESNGLLIHTHLAEMQTEVEGCQSRHGVTPTRWFNDIGLWERKCLAAHAVCLTKEDVEILGRHKVGISHNPGSNLKLETKIAPVADLRAAGCAVGLGTDSTASNNNLDLLEEGRLAALLQTFHRGVGKLPAYDVLRMLTIEGAKAIGLENEIGTLETGKEADLTVWDLDLPHAAPLYHPYSHLVYSAAASDVRHAVVGGEILMKDRRVLGLSENQFRKEVEQWGRKIARGNSSN